VPGWRPSEETARYLPLLQEAVWQERRLRLIYERADGTAVERLVDPLGLVAKGSVWYLVAAVEGDPRTYRTSRIQLAELTDEVCARPKDFDLAAFWEQSQVEFRAHLPRYFGVIRAHPSILGRVRSGERFTRVACEHPPEADGWVRLEMIFEEEHGAREFILSFGPQIEVVDPPALREQVIAAAAGIARLYAERDSTTAVHARVDETRQA